MRETSSAIGMAGRLLWRFSEETANDSYGVMIYTGRNSTDARPIEVGHVRPAQPSPSRPVADCLGHLSS